MYNIHPASDVNFRVTPEAMQCFVQEWGVRRGDHIRIFARYGAGASPEGAYSLGIQRDKPKHPAVSFSAYDIVFYVEESDVWYLDGRDILVDHDAVLDEIVVRLVGSLR